MSFSLVLLALALGADGPQRVLVLDTRTTAVSADQARALTDLIAAGIATNKELTVISGNELRDLLQLESEKQAAGCESEAGDCMAEIAGALDAGLVVASSVTQLGGRYIATLALFDASKQQVVKREQVETDDESELPRALRDGATRLIGAPSSASSGMLPVAVTGAGGTLLIVGGVMAGWAAATSYDPGSSGDDKSLSETLWPLGIGVAAVGAAGVAAGGALLALGGGP